jgi:hypothetical protein
MKMYDEGTVFDVSEPEVTFDQEAHRIPEGGEKTGGIEWSISAHLHGDDGKPYWIDCSVLSYPALDLLAGVIGPSDAGELVLTGTVVGSRIWASTEPPDCPFTMLDWENVEGTFTYKHGRTQTLTNGVAGNLVRQWRPYPSPYLPDAAELEM